MSQAHTQPAAAGAAAPAIADDPLLAMVQESLDDDQAQDVVTIPLEGKSSIADYMVVASGRSTRQVAAIAQKLAERLKKSGHPAPRIEGLPAACWSMPAGSLFTCSGRKCAVSIILSECGDSATIRMALPERCSAGRTGERGPGRLGPFVRNAVACNRPGKNWPLPGSRTVRSLRQANHLALQT